MFIRQFTYLDALAREKHFRRAAEACNISQPSLSAGIRQLEEELGVLIVERGRTFRGFTREGEAVLAHARRILAETATMRDAIAELREGVRGTLRLGVVPTALPVVAKITAPFASRFPRVTLTVLSLSSEDIQQGIDQFELDVGITYLNDEPLKRVASKPLYDESYHLLTRADSNLARRNEISWAEASGLDLCLLTRNMQNRRIIDDVFRRSGHVPQPAMETNSIFNLCSHAGLKGISSIVPQQLLDFFGIPDGTCAIPLVLPTIRQTVGLVVADRQPMPPLARNLVMMTDALPAR